MFDSALIRTFSLIVIISICITIILSCFVGVTIIVIDYYYYVYTHRVGLIILVIFVGLLALGTSIKLVVSLYQAIKTEENTNV